MAQGSIDFLAYGPAIEEIAPDEAETFAKIADTFAEMGAQVENQEGRAVRVSHAKPTALLTGELVIDPALPPELAQGIAKTAARYEALIRFAQGPGEILDDSISTHRGMAVKLLDVPGARIAESSGGSTQDFVFEAHSKAFINANATRFLANLKAGVSHAPSLAQGVKQAVRNVARATEAGLEAIGLESKTLGFFGHPRLHPLAEAYFSQAPIRWGAHVAKLGFFPDPATCDALAELKIENADDFDAFRTAMVDHFSRAGASFELRVQLATDLDTTPIEDASVEWPEEVSPYRRVAWLVIEPQIAWTPARDDYFDRLSFRPANSIEDHRPLGQVMRARLFVYQLLAARRMERNGVSPVEPRSTIEVPD